MKFHESLAFTTRWRTVRPDRRPVYGLSCSAHVVHHVVWLDLELQSRSFTRFCSSVSPHRTISRSKMSQALAPPALVTLTSISGKGKGLVASQSIKSGTVLISEPPLFRIFTSTLEDCMHSPPSRREVHQTLKDLLDSVPSNVRDAYLDLPVTRPGVEDPINCRRVHLFPLGDEPTEDGFFETACRTNHACVPNAASRWDDKSGLLSAFLTTTSFSSPSLIAWFFFGIIQLFMLLGTFLPARKSP